MSRRWQDAIDDWLCDAPVWQLAPANLYLPDTLRTLLNRIEDRSNSNPHTLGAIQTIAIWSVKTIVAQLAVHRNTNDDIRQLSQLYQRGRNLKEYATHVYEKLMHYTLQYYSLTGSDSIQELGYALSRVAYLVRAAYPVAGEDEPITPDIRLRPADMLEVVLYLAVVIRVHRNICGEAANNKAVATLVRTLKQLL